MKIRKIVKLGHLPQRGDEAYDYFCDCSLTNCFEHALLNLTNSQLKEINFSFKEAELFKSLCPLISTSTTYDDSTIKQIKKFALQNFLTTVNACSLQAKEDSGESLKFNQWRIALYFEDDPLEFHFLLQEKDGKWSGKWGSLAEVEKFDTLPQTIQDCETIYRLHSVYTITNPYAKQKTGSHKVASATSQERVL